MVSDFVWKDLLAKHGFEDDTNSPFLLRASVPGDYRSLIDIIETKKDTLYRYDDSDTAQNRTNRAIHEIRLRMQDAVLIPRYAKLAGVPFDKNAISFGIVPKLASSHIIVTEHPNHEDVLIQEGPFKTNYRNSTFFLSSVDYDSDVTLKVKMFLNFLRDRGVLQVDIAYNLELGLDSEGNMVLFQIRELCKKMFA